MSDEQRMLPLFPLGVVLFPGMALPLHVFEERYKLMMGACMSCDQVFGVTLIKEGQEVGEPAIPFEIGTLARIAKIQQMPDGRMNLIAVGVQRFRILDTPRPIPYLVAQVRMLPTSPAEAPAELTRSVSQELSRYRELLGADASAADEVASDAETLSFRAAAELRVAARDRQRLLEIDEPVYRLDAVLRALRRERNVLELFNRARDDQKNAGPFSLN